MPWLTILLPVAAVLVATATLVAVRWFSHPLFHRGDFVPRRWPRRRLAPPAATPPIEKTAANLRRLGAMLDGFDSSLPAPGKATKRAAAHAAYEQLLREACHSLGVTESLAQTTGIDHEAERLRIEAALEECGLVLRPRQRPRTAG